MENMTTQNVKNDIQVQCFSKKYKEMNEITTQGRLSQKNTVPK